MKYVFSLGLIVILSLLAWFYFLSPSNPQTSANFHESSNPVNLPVISRQDILNASDLKAGIKQAVQSNDHSAIEEWLKKASELAIEAGLDQEDIQYLQSELATKFVVFRAKRSLFNDAVEQAYYAVEDITPIKEQYPEAADLFAKVDALIKNRNELIQQIAEVLAAGEPVNDSHLKAAQDNWKSSSQKTD